MRQSLRKAIQYLLESDQNHLCPKCGQKGPFPQKEIIIGSDNQPDSADLITCPCGFQWQSAFRIILSPFIPASKDQPTTPESR